MSKHNPATAFITIARIIRERGTRGEVIIHPLTGSALRISSGSDLQVRTKTNERKTLKVCTVRDDRGSLLVTFHGISTREDASALRQATIEIDGNELPELPEHEYYHHQIVGLTVVTAGGDERGKIGPEAFTRRQFAGYHW